MSTSAFSTSSSNSTFPFKKALTTASAVSTAGSKYSLTSTVSLNSGHGQRLKQGSVVTGVDE